MQRATEKVTTMMYKMYCYDGTGSQVSSEVCCDSKNKIITDLKALEKLAKDKAKALVNAADEKMVTDPGVDYTLERICVNIVAQNADGSQSCVISYRGTKEWGTEKAQ